MDKLYIETDETKNYALEFGPEDEGRRLDTVLSDKLEDVSRNRAQILISGGSVTINEKTCLDKDYRVKNGDRTKVSFRTRIPLELIPEDIKIDIVYEDDELLVVNKAKGMVVHPAPGSESGTLVSALLYHMKESGYSLPEINGELRPGIVHRIDKNTSGLLVIAKTDKAHKSLSKQLAEHSVKRIYKAIVHGVFSEKEGTVDEPLGRDRKDRKKQNVTNTKDGRRAVTHYKVLENLVDHSLLELKLETGRTHQIRVHMAYIGHPVLGDDLYGPRRLVKKARECGAGQYLHAETIGFIHPKSGEYMEFSVDPPKGFSEILLGKSKV